LDYVEEGTPYLMRQLCVDRVAKRKAVMSMMNEFYPSQSGNKTLKQLIQ